MILSLCSTVLYLHQHSLFHQDESKVSTPYYGVIDNDNKDLDYCVDDEEANDSSDTEDEDGVKDSYVPDPEMEKLKGKKP